jgi:ABC-type transport system involved in multi-copper enzyme maturation permease subunit
MNPEFLRNARIHLRRGRALTAAVICGVISVIVLEFLDHGVMDGSGILTFVLYLQATVLLIVGGISCLQSVHREKELNTFDYQRVTQLAPLEVAVGKLFGAPVMAYFIALCLTPVALIGAVVGRIPFSIVLESYLILLLGCVAYHAFALVISSFWGPGSTAAAIILFLLLVFVSSIDWFQAGGIFSVHRLSPLCAPQLPGQYLTKARLAAAGQDYSGWEDSFLGTLLPHAAVAIGIYVTFTAWFLAALNRNLERDPLMYEIYSPNQALAFAFYLTLLTLGFFEWTMLREPLVAFGGLYSRPVVPPIGAIQDLLKIVFVIFFMLGLVLLRNRDRVRSQSQKVAERKFGVWAAAWPAPYLLVGAIAAGAGIVALVARYRPPGSYWNLGLPFFEVVFFAIWIIRDFLYLQWMALRRSNRPLVSGLLYLLVFYACASVTFAALGMFGAPGGAAFTSVFLPTPLFSLDFSRWDSERALWILALTLQAGEALLFILLLQRRLRHLNHVGLET